MADILKELKDKETKLRNLQNEKSKQDGKKEQLMKQLQTEFGVDSLEKAVTELENIQNEVEKNENELQTVATQMDTIINTANKTTG